MIDTHQTFHRELHEAVAMRAASISRNATTQQLLETALLNKEGRRT